MSFGKAMSGRSSGRGQAKLIKQFMTVTGASRDVAKSMLEACNGNVELAISMHLDGGDGMVSNGEAASGARSSSKASQDDESDG